jgi:AraC-like DNA-binding protein
MQLRSEPAGSAGQRPMVRPAPAAGAGTLAGWRELLCSRIARLDVEAKASGGRCTGSLREIAVGSLRVHRVAVRADPYVVRRALRRPMENDAPVIVSVQVHGQSVVHQHGREALIHPGELVLFDAAHSYQVFYPGGDHTHVALRIPREMLERSLVTLADLTAVSVSGKSGMGAAVGPLLAGLPAALPVLDSAAAGRLVSHAIDLVTAVFLENARHDTEREARLIRAERFIRTSLDDDGLGPAAVADAINVSVGHLHRIFRSTGRTVCRSIMQARIERCADELRDTGHVGRTIAEIAYRNGFKDAAHFTRVFVRHYGVTPSRWRRDATAG